jgi:hypothetical protein
MMRNETAASDERFEIEKKTCICHCYFIYRSRAALLSGIYPFRLGLQVFISLENTYIVD